MTPARDAIAALLEAAAEAGARKALADVAAVPERYADLRKYGAGIYRAALRDIRSGKLPAYEAARGKRLVRLDDWHRWLESHPVRVASEPVDEVADIVEINRARRAGGGK
jgi:hypothetical protein